MAEEIHNRGQESSLLAKIREGMAVFDHTGKQVGTVDRVHLGQVGEEIAPSTVRPPSNEAGRVPADTGLGEVLEDLFDPADQIDDAVQKLLVKQGFIRIADAPSASTRYVRADQISSVAEYRVIVSL